MRLTFNAYITVENVEPDRILETYNRLAEIVRGEELDVFLRSKGIDLVSIGITGDYDEEQDDDD